MSGRAILGIDSLLKQYIGEEKDIVEIKTSNLTTPGENYSSILLQLDVSLKNLKTKEDEQLHAVAKIVNTEVNEFFRLGAKPQMTKEIAFYSEILPLMQQFQKEHNMEVMDFFPKFYAARKNLHGNNDEIDDDAVIIFENLKTSGFSNIDRVVGFDLDGAKLVLRDLSIFHGVAIAVKLKKPDVFEAKIKKYCKIRGFPEMPKRTGPQQAPEWVAYVAQQEKCQPYFDEFTKILGGMGEKDFFSRTFAEPFATISHSDFWVNNTMQLEKDEKFVKNKIIDFQLYQYGSGICDLIHFIFASCQIDISRNHFEDLIKFYHEHFIDTLKKLHCSTIEFEYDKFLERVEIEAPSEFIHTIFMAVPIQGKKGVANVDVESDKFVVEGSVTQEVNEKIAHEVNEFGKRRWLKCV